MASRRRLRKTAPHTCPPGPFCSWRLGPDEDLWTRLFYTGLVGSVVLTAVVPFHLPSPTPSSVVLLVLTDCAGTAGQLMPIRALWTAKAGLPAPFCCTGLVFAVFRGLALFGQVPDTPTLTGALVIAGAGIYVWPRETRAGRAVR